MSINKDSIYKQIEAFNNQLTNPDVETSQKYYQAYWYVENETAQDCAKFIGFIQNKTSFFNKSKNPIIIDLAFGSGNLTSHIVLENFEKYKKIIFNDKIKDKTNQELIKLFNNTAEIYSNDFLSETEWNNIKADIVIFNPQVGGSYTKGKITLNPETIKKIQSLLAKILNEEGAIFFYGDENNFKSLFKNFKTIYHYKRDKLKEKDLFIIIKKGKEKTLEEYCKYDNTFDKCKEEDKANKVEGDIPVIQTEIGTAIKELAKTTQTDNSLAQEDKIDETEKKKVEDEKTEPFKIDVSPVGNIDFPHKNILLKGVPGTGKSRLIDVKLLKEIGLNTITHPNILRINVHSASSNSDLMQGIGVSAHNGEIGYYEKQGLILNHLKEAIKKPNQAFAIVLEEIQENNLNELIGDLIYLIEDEKRADVSDFIKENKEFKSFDVFVNELIKDNENTHFVQIPYLVSSYTKYRKLIIPKNLYFFCTSNYRDDKKIIEDNLLRRFDLIELYPKVSVIKDKDVANFLKVLNDGILSVLNGKEIHSDRFLIGHAYWINVKDEKTFYQALLKTLTEFKDIREIEFSDVKKFFEKIDTDTEKTPFKTDLSILKNGKNYKEIIFSLQEKAFGDLLKDNEK